MNPEPAMPADQPFVIDGRIWRRIVIAFYLASSSAAVLLSRGMGLDLAWIPGLGWAANIAIVLAAIALARTDAPLRLQLALAFAAPVLFVVLRSGMAAYSGQLGEENILMLGLAFGWAIYSDFLGSVVAFGIVLAALASRRASMQPGVVLLRTFSALGWVMAATWLYILGFVLAANYRPEYEPYMNGMLLWIFTAATVIGWGLAPLWLVGAIALFLSSFMRKQRPALADTAALVLVVCLMGVYITLAILLD